MARSKDKIKGFVDPRPSDVVGVVKSKPHYDNRRAMQRIPSDNWDAEVDPHDLQKKRKFESDYRRLKRKFHLD